MARPRTDIQPRIIKAARAVFARVGVDGSSLRQIARGAKTSIGMIYYYFPTKDDLFQAVVEDVYSKLLTDLEATLTEDTAIEEKLFRLYCRIGAANDLELLTLRLVLQEMLVSPSRRARLLERFQRGHLGLVQRALAEGVQQGRVRRDLHPLVLMTSALSIGAAPQFVLRALGGPQPERSRSPFGAVPSGAELAKDLLNVLFHGIGSAAATGKPRLEADA